MHPRYYTSYCCINFSFARSEIGIASPTARPLRAYLDDGVNFTGLFFLSDPAAWRDGRHPGGRSFVPPSTLLPHPHVDLRRLVVAFTDRDAFTDFAHRRLASRYSV